MKIQRLQQLSLRFEVGERTLLSRRGMFRLVGALAVLALGVAPEPVAAQIVDWSADDAGRYAAFRKAFGEYNDIPDREFATRMEALFRSLDENPNADVVAAEVSRRLPEYRDAPRTRLQRELTALFRRAKNHFERNP